jgi:ATPase subunit of ABC transporter with duplicated ATPase domains
MFNAYPSAKLGGDMLRIDILTNHVGDKIAVDAANIFVNEPSMIGIIGRSGAGKFKLLRMANRLSDATSGRSRATKLAIALCNDLSTVQPRTTHGRGIECAPWNAEEPFDCRNPFQSVSANLSQGC